jgi:hypothetical protein
MEVTSPVDREQSKEKVLSSDNEDSDVKSNKKFEIVIIESPKTFTLRNVIELNQSKNFKNTIPRF